jgi:hypothetical protein
MLAIRMIVFGYISVQTVTDAESQHSTCSRQELRLTLLEPIVHPGFTSILLRMSA